ncbi:tRNA (adenosine(37)-N6)-threonylcarbamoyltransferase complex ATPase subunit type 1 TsaE [Roseinatronobacter bogoriensis]|uniref:tRNA threonylcarbamoyladenosine biosynthesis protein TsaE n=1 Tax=Roseinatronobacter bogoriensis subsp. barguzinensis TaxID=441209 RepID=A0A2K8KCB8_9RHOB|nr:MULTISPECIES: tRNA (adenosine(37)-N6)-threonylcarbamoyltransferase complex ATPase subunit type 1 TsaE [Rhodobaca]ATX67089.1 tRNA (adenosine(37)-N6)-threonylcarbamoyltransferase complex ATPase subunit type 1 TsaE [Rhodobaca barguzinensis]MBB4206601.1 tRNA threonylcarbamoyladenosine biosynthesis protein TsaE [Rhodobaca bogoriensis DSM 18756]TDW41344.1 tRNA threonylcarbamoyladenosine biosynthesis protein TsaE [Rhodobaca barguzinensis]TDY74478.1 tRNA threonylcarbamoyladenosine biosynthesis prote
MTNSCTLRLTSTSPEQTAEIAARLGAGLGAGDALLLSGPVGAGKSLFARALIQSRLAALDRYEDVPSPSFTLVQTYDLETVELWHTDLYRLADPHDALELGLDQAFDEAICLVEWPERLGAFQPASALHLSLETTDDPAFRALHFSATDMRWASLLNSLAHNQPGPT